jgi:opacity protein-like surface antigen
MGSVRARAVACGVLASTLILASLAFGQEAPPPPKKHPVELYALAGYGDAVCDKNKPNSDCPVAGALALGLGGDWRFVNHFAVGLELGIWAFHVRDAWRGQLTDPATDVSFSSVYLAPFGRWYWFDTGKIDPYLQAGLGFGSVTAKASNSSGTYDYTASGIAYLLGIGVDFQLSDLFRIGPQFLAYLHVSSKICATTNGTENCHSPGTNPDGNREGLALPWRLVAVGTFTFGGP